MDTGELTDTITAQPIVTMPTDPQKLLTLMQWLSPAYPVGGFAYSHGLEQAVADGGVSDASSFRGWLEDVMRHGAGLADARFLAAAFNAGPEDVTDLDKKARAFAASAERLKETDLMGRAFGDITANVWGYDVSGLSYPVAVGRAAQSASLDLQSTLLAYVQAFVSNLVACAQRLIRLGQTAAQAIIRDFGALCAEIAQTARTGNISQVSGSAFLADIAAMQHEELESRVFRT